MKNLQRLLCLISIGIFSLIIASCTGNREREHTAEETATEIEEADVPSAKMSEEIYVDIMAHQMYWSAQYADAMEDGYTHEKATRLATEMADKMADLYKKHGVSENAFDEFSSGLMDDPEVYVNLLDKVGKRVEELVEGN